MRSTSGAGKRGTCGLPSPSACLTSLLLRLLQHIGIAILRRPSAGCKGLHLAPCASRQDHRARPVDAVRRSSVKLERVGGIQAVAGVGKTGIEPRRVAPLNPYAALAV